MGWQRGVRILVPRSEILPQPAMCPLPHSRALAEPLGVAAAHPVPLAGVAWKKMLQPPGFPAAAESLVLP